MRFSTEIAVYHGNGTRQAHQGWRSPMCTTSFWSGNAIIGVGTTEFWEWECNYGNLVTFFRQNCCHQMADFNAKMRQILCRLGLRPRPRWGAYSAPPDPLAGFKGPYFYGKGRGPTSKGRGGDGEGGGKGRGGEGNGHY